MMTKTTALLAPLLRRMPASELIAVFEDCFNERIKPRIFPDSSTFLNSFRKQGYEIYFISSTLEPLAELLRDYYGFGRVIASKLEIKNGHFTGNLDGNICFGPEKLRHILSVAKKDGINLMESFAFSDHISDIPMLDVVGHPVVINPGGKLRKIAKQKNWEIRKLRIKPN